MVISPNFTSKLTTNVVIPYCQANFCYAYQLKASVNNSELSDCTNTANFFGANDSELPYYQLMYGVLNRPYIEKLALLNGISLTN